MEPLNLVVPSFVVVTLPGMFGASAIALDFHAIEVDATSETWLSEVNRH